MSTWVSPTGHVDPDSKWLNEANAYDGNTGTFAGTTYTDTYLELTIAAIQCDKVRFYLAGGFTRYVIDVYYSADWHNIHDATFTIGWNEVSIGSEQSVTAARVKSVASAAYVYEFEFGIPDPINDGVSETFALSDTVAIAGLGAVSETFAFTDSVFMDIVGQKLTAVASIYRTYEAFPRIHRTYEAIASIERTYRAKASIYRTYSAEASIERTYAAKAEVRKD